MTNIYEWFAIWDVHIAHDITTDCDCEQSSCEHCYQIYWLSTFSDRSVGIFPHQLTPTFRSEYELIDYIHKHKKEIEKELNNG